MRKVVISIGLALIAALLVANSCWAQINFKPYVKNGIGWPTCVNIADMNNDGLNDVIMGWYYGCEISMFYQKQDGQLDRDHNIYHYNLKLRDFQHLSAMDTKDINNDNLPDIVIATRDSIIIFINDNGTPILDTLLHCSATGIKIEDLNNDGLMDIAARDSRVPKSFITVFYQNTNKTFAPISYPVHNYAGSQIEIGDVTNDGLNDVICLGDQSIIILEQLTTGYLDAPTYSDSYNHTDDYPGGIAVGKVGNDEAIVASCDGNVAVWKQTIDSTILYDAYEGSGPIALADIDGDKKNEIIVAQGGELHQGGELPISIYPNPEDSSNYITFPVPYGDYNRQGLAIGDINNDGLNDIVLADHTNGMIILYNDSEPVVNPDDTTEIPIIDTISTTVENDNIINTTIFPNPTTDKLNIKFSAMAEDINIEIFSETGQKMFDQKFNFVEDVIINVDNFNSGLYFIKIRNNNNNSEKTSTFIKI